MADRPLLERDERLLLQWLDSEGGLLLNYRAVRLLKRSAAARIFIEEMARVHDATSLLGAALGERSLSLWERVERRIEQERYHELLLGKRNVNIPQLRRPLEGFQWRAAAVLATAAVVVFAVFVGSGRSSNPPQIAQTANSEFPPLIDPQLQLVSGNSNVDRSRPQLPSESLASLELDWMHSEGRLQLIHDPLARAPIIWVNRGKRMAAKTQSDGPAVVDNRVILLEERFPAAVSVSGRSR